MPTGYERRRRRRLTARTYSRAREAVRTASATSRASITSLPLRRARSSAAASLACRAPSRMTRLRRAGAGPRRWTPRALGRLGGRRGGHLLARLLRLRERGRGDRRGGRRLGGGAVVGTARRRAAVVC